MINEIKTVMCVNMHDILVVFVRIHTKQLHNGLIAWNGCEIENNLLNHAIDVIRMSI